MKERNSRTEVLLRPIESVAEFRPCPAPGTLRLTTCDRRPSDARNAACADELVKTQVLAD